MNDVKGFLENKYSEYIVSANTAQYIERRYVVNNLNNAELCECIEDAPDWEICEIYGLLDELADRADTTFDYNSDSWESDVLEAIKLLKRNQ